NISEVGTGVWVKRGTLEMTDGLIEFKGEHGVKVESGVTSARLTGTRITGGGQGTGVFMESSGTMTISGGSISNVEKGVEAIKGRLTINGGAMTGVQTGIDMSGNGTLTVNKGTRIEFTGNGQGVKVGSGVTMATLTDVTITGTGSGQGTGVYATGTGAGTLNMTGVNISEVGTGVWVKQGTLTMDKGEITFKGEHGVKIESGVTNARLTDVVIRGTSGQGTGVYVENGAVTLNMTGVNISEVGTGVWMKGGENGVTSATLTGTRITGTSGQGTGVLMESSQTLNMTGVTISNVGTGVWVKRGTLTMNNGEIGFKGAGEGKGLSIEGTANATITGTRITGTSGQGTGVLMESSQTLRMTGVNISEVGTGVWVKQGTL
ncbi:hypothetical protein, partial [Bartonella bovis]|uniref:hypothetical protein n=1 Tax=Bartonella bovis TaxID=155194 RepID=UPI001959489E